MHIYASIAGNKRPKNDQFFRLSVKITFNI